MLEVDRFESTDWEKLETHSLSLYVCNICHYACEKDDLITYGGLESRSNHLEDLYAEELYG